MIRLALLCKTALLGSALDSLKYSLAPHPMTITNAVDADASMQRPCARSAEVAEPGTRHDTTLRCAFLFALYCIVFELMSDLSAGCTFFLACLIVFVY